MNYRILEHFRNIQIYYFKTTYVCYFPMRISKLLNIFEIFKNKIFKIAYKHFLKRTTKLLNIFEIFKKNFQIT